MFMSIIVVVSKKLQPYPKSHKMFYVKLRTPEFKRTIRISNDSSINNPIKNVRKLRVLLDSFRVSQIRRAIKHAAPIAMKNVRYLKTMERTMMKYIKGKNALYTASNSFRSTPRIFLKASRSPKRTIRIPEKRMDRIINKLKCERKLPIIFV